MDDFDPSDVLAVPVVADSRRLQVGDESPQRWEVEVDSPTLQAAIVASREVGDFAIVHLLDDEQDLLLLDCLFHPEPKTEELLRKIFDAGVISIYSEIFGPVVQQGRCYEFSELSGDTPRATPSTAFFPALYIHSFIVAPIIGANRTFVGTLMVGRCMTPYRYDQKDVATITWLAATVGRYHFAHGEEAGSLH